MTSSARPPGALEAWPCQQVCVWRPTGEARPGAGSRALRVFQCAGCGSEWVRTEAWTPIDAGGVVPFEIAAECTAGREVLAPVRDALVSADADNEGSCSSTDS